MPRSKKDVMLEKATPEKILESYYKQCRCWGTDQYDNAGPCDICKGQRIALVQLEKMREELAKYKAAHEMTTFFLPKKTKEELAKMQEDFKPIRGLAEDKVKCWRCEGSGSEVAWAENNHGFSETCITCNGTGVREPESVRTASRKSESQS